MASNAQPVDDQSYEETPEQGATSKQDAGRAGKEKNRKSSDDPLLIPDIVLEAPRQNDKRPRPIQVSDDLEPGSPRDQDQSDFLSPPMQAGGLKSPRSPRRGTWKALQAKNQQDCLRPFNTIDESIMITDETIAPNLRSLHQSVMGTGTLADLASSCNFIRSSSNHREVPNLQQLKSIRFMQDERQTSPLQKQRLQFSSFRYGKEHFMNSAPNHQSTWQTNLKKFSLKLANEGFRPPEHSLLDQQDVRIIPSNSRSDDPFISILNSFHSKKLAPHDLQYKLTTLDPMSGSITTARPQIGRKYMNIVNRLKSTRNERPDYTRLERHQFARAYPSQMAQ